jgi:hypothetical protein
MEEFSTKNVIIG